MLRTMIGVLVVALAMAVMVHEPGAAIAGGQKGQKGEKGGKGKVVKGDPNGKNNVVGVRWEYKVIDPKTKDVIDEGKFRAHDFKVYRGASEIGAFAVLGRDHVKVEITKGKLKGTWNLRMTDTKPPIWRGELKREDGSHQRMTVKFLDD